MKRCLLFTSLIFTLSLLTGQANANIKETKAYHKYVTVLPADKFQRTGKIEQYFSLNCPVCYLVEPYVANIRQNAQGKIPLAQLHVGASRKSWRLSQRVFATLSLMGLELEYKSKLFDHVQAKDGFVDEEQVFKWSKAHDWHKRFEDLYHSKKVDNYIAKVSENIKNYKLTQVPTFIVNGRYKVLWGNDISKEEFSKLLLELYRQSLDEKITST